ncbi:putative sorbitol dehydrogenase [Gordonia soli NBRC 108243]|uniref:Putative sorbitol dehydrogenase n=1 Tax=Gordonia soli NBRC 108243 TaxID=1223545 RepID=M0QQB3_9ACTN|nr:putative sorbitol dehydrogenase [Gordonia soli NBRC 108243]
MDGSLTVESREIPTPAPDEVLVRVAAVGVCGSDTHYLRHGRIGDHVVTGPIVLGHEASGRVVAVGSAVGGDRIGERVSIEPQTPDPTSRESRRGDYNLCPSMRFYGTPPIDGALAEFVTIGASFAHPVPEHVSDEAAALMEPLSVAIASIRKAGVGMGESILITGAGPIGLLCAQVARAAGLTRIIVVEPGVQRRSAALRFGATEVAVSVADSDAGQTAVDAFVDASGAPPAVLDGISAVRPGGRVVLVGMGADTMELPVSLIQNRELVLTGVFRYANTWPTAIELVATGKVDLDDLVTSHHGIADVRAGLDADRIPSSIKAVVHPGIDTVEPAARPSS